MNKAWWVLPVAALAVTTAMAGGSKEFVMELPQGIDAAHRVVLELHEVRLPRNAAVIFRARAIEENGTEVSLGSVGVLAKSRDAEGTALYATLRIEVTKVLQRWRRNHADVREIRLRVVPYAGAEPLANLDWSVASAGLKILAP